MKAHYNQTIKVITPFVIRERTLVFCAWRAVYQNNVPDSVRRRPSFEINLHDARRKADTGFRPATTLRRPAVMLKTSAAVLGLSESTLSGPLGPRL